LKGNIKLTELLINNGADLNSTNKYGRTPLYIASFEGYEKIVKLLISKGIDINIIDDDGWTPLHEASKRGHTEIIKLLIKNGIDINIKDKNGQTAEDVAYNQEVRELIITTKQNLLERQEVLINEISRIFSIITRYTEIINITYLISLQRK